MPDIKNKIEQIRSAVYGRDVRESIASSLEAWNDYNSQTQEKIDTAAAKVDTAASTLTGLQTAISNANTAKSNLNSATSTANASKTALDNSKAAANTAKANLDASKAAADTAKTALDTATATATSTKTSLETATSTGNTAKTQLDQATSAANTAKSNLTLATTTANNSKSALETATSAGNTTKSGLVTATNNAATAQDSLESVIDEAADMTLSSSAVAALWAMQRTGKLYQTKIPKFAASNTTACIKTLDNAEMVCTPSTDTTKGQDDYIESGELLFQWRNCNYIRKADGFAVPVAFEGDASYKTSGAVDVGVCFPTFYYSFLEKDDGYYLTISDSPNSEWQLQPAEPAIRQDGTVSPYFVVSKYVSIKGSDGMPRSLPGGAPWNFTSYLNMPTRYGAKGPGYHGAGSFRNTLQYIWILIKYANKSSQAYFAGVTSQSYQYPCAAPSSTASKIFTVTAAQAANVDVGALVSVGYPTGMNGSSVSIDRGASSMYSIANQVKVLAKETLENGNVALTLDCEPFTTNDRNPIVSGGTSYDAHVYLSSMGRETGETDQVIGRYDGSIVSNTNGRYTYRVQGVEYANGYYTVASDTVFSKKADYTIDVFKCKAWMTRKSALADLEAQYAKVGTIPASPNGGGYGDAYIGDAIISDGCVIPYKWGSSSSTGTGDCIYFGGNAVDRREFLMAGYLGNGWSAGASCLSAGSGLSNAYWHFASAD